MPEFVWLLLAVPVATGFVGWVTNWSAVKMIFYPRVFRGIGPIGWQGIIPRHGSKFAATTADMATENLISARELAERLDAEEIERLFAATLDAESEALVADAAEVLRPGAWQQLPEGVRKTIVDQVRSRGREVAKELFDKLQGVSGELLDLHRLVYSQLSGKNVERLARLTRQVGAKEFKFIEYYGGVFGLIIGLGQVGVWSALQRWWLMPVVGVLVGLATNWLAIQMIFRPFERIRYLGIFAYQGLFPKRQAEIARDYSALLADEIFTARNLIRLVTEGPAGERIARLISDTVSERMDAEWQKMKAFVPIEVTPDQLATVKEHIVARIAATVPEVQPALEAYLDRKLDIGRTIREKLEALSKPEFERVLRGVFEEDEVTLILVGGFLGGAVGCLQALAVVALG